MGFLLKKAAVKKSKEEITDQEKYSIVCYDKYPIGPAVSLRKTILNTRKQLPIIESPILIIQGILDGKWIVNSSRIIYNEVNSENKELVLLQNANHALPQGSEKEKVHELILGFIQRNSKLLKM
jgi:esterase/lipase